MLSALYLVPLAAWFMFTYHMHHSGGRPTTIVWWAFMTGLGTFELGKGLFTEFGANPPLGVALIAALAAAGAVLVAHSRRAWVEASPAAGR